MAKDMQSLLDSREIRAFLLQRYGLEPRSILHEDWKTKVPKKYYTYAQQKADSAYAGTTFEVSGSGARGGAFSDFPHTIARFLLKFFCYDGMGPYKTTEPGRFGNYLPVVLDPFAGHNSRMSDVYACGLNYLGHDICAEFMKANQEIRAELLEENSRSMLPTQAQIEINEGDSRDIINYDSVGDFLITSPPFWNIEDYGPETGQLGKRDYKSFLVGLTKVFANCYKALKPGAYAVVEVNDFREGGTFYSYHTDTIISLKYVGFTQHDMLIIDYGRAFLSIFLTDVEYNKIMPKVHSYMIVMRKPCLSPEKRTKEDKIEFRNNLKEAAAVQPISQNGGQSRLV